MARCVLSLFAIAFSATAAKSAFPADRLVSPDVRVAASPLNPLPKVCVGAGRGAEGLRADWQRQLLYVKRQCSFTYVRMHGLLGKDAKKWEDLIRALVEHFTERYGKAEVRTWYFEVLNEPNLDGFFAATQQDSFELYARTAHTIKSVSPAYRVGGPATAGCAWLPEFIKYCATNHVPVDFASTHDYAVDVGHLDETGNAGTILSHNPRNIYGNVLRMREQITSSPLPNLELHVTEWSAS